MSPEPANCPLCKTSAERIRARATRHYHYTCPSCGTFDIEASALSPARGLPTSAREDVRRLRACGHQPRIETHGRDGVRVVGNVPHAMPANA